MKPTTIRFLTFFLLLSAIPSVAQASDRSVVPGAGVIAWLIVGLIGGYLASRVVNKRGEGILLDIVLGIIGGFIGGIIFRAFGSQGVTGFNLWSILVAFFGGVVLLTIYHLIRGTRPA